VKERPTKQHIQNGWAEDKAHQQFAQYRWLTKPGADITAHFGRENDDN
jgi:hypothetical protein